MGKIDLLTGRPRQGMEHIFRPRCFPALDKLFSAGPGPPSQEALAEFMRSTHAAITEHVDAASHSVLRAAVHGGRNLMEESAEEDSPCQPIEVFGVTATYVGLSILIVGAVVAARSRLGRSGRGTVMHRDLDLSLV